MKTTKLKQAAARNIRAVNRAVKFRLLNKLHSKAQLQVFSYWKPFSAVYSFVQGRFHFLTHILPRMLDTACLVYHYCFSERVNATLFPSSIKFAEMISSFRSKWVELNDIARRIGCFEPTEGLVCMLSHLVTIFLVSCLLQRILCFVA